MSRRRWAGLAGLTAALALYTAGADRLWESGLWPDLLFLTLVLFPATFALVWLLLPESVSYLVQRRPAGALERINATLLRLGHRTVDTLPDAVRELRQGSWRQLFEPGRARATTLFTIAYFAHIMTFYFMLKWIPKIVVDMGFEPSSAGG